MRYWLITDTHFGHENIKKYCNRPDGFEDLILENLNPTEDEGVCPGDVLIHLGDVCFGIAEVQAEWPGRIQLWRRYWRRCDLRRAVAKATGWDVV